MRRMRALPVSVFALPALIIMEKPAFVKGRDGENPLADGVYVASARFQPSNWTIERQKCSFSGATGSVKGRNLLYLVYGKQNGAFRRQGRAPRAAP